MRLCAALFILLLVPAAARCQQNPAPAAEPPNPPAAQPMSGEAPELTLDEAIRLSMAKNPSIRTAILDVTQQEENVAAARTQRFPQLQFYALESFLLTPLSFEFEKGSLGTLSTGEPIPPKTIDISTGHKLSTLLIGQAQQPLSQLHRINLGIRGQEVGAELQREVLRQQRQKVANAVKQAYYALVQTQSSLEAAEETVQFDRELDRVVGQNLLQQTALKADSLKAKAKLAQDEYNALTVRDSLASQKERLNDLLGRDIRADFRVSAMPETVAVEENLEAAQNRALAQRPEVRQAKLKVEMADYQRRAKKAEYIPDISFTVNYFAPLTVALFPRNIASVGILLSWQPFDWGQKKHQLAQLTQATEEASVNLDEARNQILLDVNNNFRKLQEARLLLSASQLAFESEKEKLRDVMNQYKVKAALLTDLMQEQANFSSASSNYQQALANFWTAKANFEKSLGED